MVKTKTNTKDKKEKLKEFNKRAEKAEKWAGGGKEAYNLAVDAEYADMHDTKLPATKTNIATTISGAVRMFFDGNISNEKIKKIVADSGLDMNNLRASVVEQTLARALPHIINSGDIERLARLGMLGGEKIEQGAAGSAGVVVKYITAQEEQETMEHIESVIGAPPKETDTND